MKAFAKDVHTERMQRKHFLVVKIKSKGILEILHSYVCETMSSNSLSGYVYYVSFIDDFSHNTCIYLLKWKNEVFSKFKEYKALVKNHTKRNIKTLWSDNGKEITSK